MRHSCLPIYKCSRFLAQVDGWRDLADLPAVFFSFVKQKSKYILVESLQSKRRDQPSVVHEVLANLKTDHGASGIYDSPEER